MRGHLGLAVSEFLLEEFDDPFDVRACGHMCQAQALVFGRQHLHQLASAQHQSLEFLQLGVGQRLDEAFALRGAGAAHGPKPPACAHPARRSWPERPSHGQSRAPCEG